MSKIDAYNEIKRKNQYAISQLHESQQRKADGSGRNHNNDKGMLKFYDRQVWDSDMKIFIHGCYGYYGSSSAYNISSDTIKQYLIKVLNEKEGEIVNRAIELLDEDIEKARLAAENEAKEVLKAVNI